MVQAEVAERLAARPGQPAYGVPSVKAAWYAERPARRRGAAAPCSGRCPNVDSGPGRLRPARRRPPTRAARGRSSRVRRRGLRPAAQDAARGARRLGRLAGRRRAGAAGCRHRPAARAASSSPSSEFARHRRTALAGEPRAGSWVSCHHRSPSARPPRSTSSSRSAPRRPTATTRSRRSSTPCRCSTRSPPRVAADGRGRSGPVTVAGPGADARPARRHATSRSGRPCCSPSVAGVDQPRAAAHPQGHPRRRRHGRRLGRRGRRAARLRRALEAGLDPRRAPRARRRARAATCPFALLGGTAIGTGRGERLTPRSRAGHVPLGRRPRRRGLSTPGGLRASSTGCARAGSCPSRGCRPR